MIGSTNMLDSHIATTPGQSTLTNPITQPILITPDSNNYNSKIKFFNYAFCTRTKLQFSVYGELPIVIDTGALMSITPILSNFTSPIKPSVIDSLGSLTKVKTPVQGQGPIALHVEDINDVQSTIDTVVYWVPSATI